MHDSRLLGVALAMLPALATAAPQRFTAAPGAEVRFRVDAPLDFIPGLSTGLSGWAEVDPAALGTASAEITVALDSFDTGVELRNEDLRDQFFQADRFKAAVLRVRGLEQPSATVLTAGREVRARAMATLSLHGVERELRVPVALRLDGDGQRASVAVSAAFDLRLADFGIQRPSRLFLKVGEKVAVTVRARFTASPPGTVPERTPVAVASNGPPGAAARPPGPAATRSRTAFLPLGRVARPGAKNEKNEKPWRFAAGTPEGRGERLFRGASAGGPGNAVSCASCHATADERWGLLQDGQVHPNRTLHGSAGRPALWQGLAPDLGRAASICAKWFMLKPAGLEAARQAELAAYLKRLGADPAPALDYRVLWLTRKSELADPRGGDVRRGKALEKKFCGGCHAERGLRSPLTPGLYEADDLVRRVRWLPGSDARQMPPIYVDRLPDAELRDIVTYLVGDPSQRIFKRRGR